MVRKLNIGQLIASLPQLIALQNLNRLINIICIIYQQSKYSWTKRTVAVINQVTNFQFSGIVSTLMHTAIFLPMKKKIANRPLLNSPLENLINLREEFIFTGLCTSVLVKHKSTDCKEYLQRKLYFISLYQLVNDAVAATVKFSVTNVKVYNVRLQFCVQSLLGYKKYIQLMS